VLQYAVSELQHAIRSIKDKDEANAIKSIHRFENAIPPRLLTGILERIVTDSPALPEPTVSGSSANFYRATQEKGIASPETRLKLEQANRDHAETVARLSEVLTTRGYQAEHNRFIDVFCRLRTGSAIFEIKSLSVGNERSQCRHALSQLYEYRYIHSLTKATLWLVLSRKPSENWIVDYLCSDRDIHVVWLEDGTFFGPSIEQFNQI
jgi:hypothetical protein